MYKYILAIILATTGCTIEVCQHEHTFRRFIVKPGQPMCGNLICKDCFASIVSFTYERPWNGPPESKQDDEIIQLTPLKEDEIEIQETSKKCEMR